jgi:lipopolysaccharide/colanic/teichoic acid biosynthesis glycosyltransferase
MTKYILVIFTVAISVSTLVLRHFSEFRIPGKVPLSHSHDFTIDWREVNLILKRILDVVLSAAGLVVLALPMLVIVVIIRITSPGPVFYRATRVGRGGRLFRLYKFRSMVVNADQVGPRITGSDDARITPVGRFLRRTKLDELPQLINVLRGEMSLVGPRPEDPKYVSFYTPEQRAVLSVRPGITGAASVMYRHEEALLECDNREERYVQEIMPAKLALDLEYVRNVSVMRDIKLITQTLRAL